jgi:hypothetical protein
MMGNKFESVSGKLTADFNVNPRLIVHCCILFLKALYQF